MDSGFGSVIVVDNLPKVPGAKVEKLTTVLKKIFGQIGVIHENGLRMPTDADGNTKGFAFIEFGNAQEAPARARADGRLQARQGAHLQGVPLRRLRQVRGGPRHVQDP